MSKPIVYDPFLKSLSSANLVEKAKHAPMCCPNIRPKHKGSTVVNHVIS